MNKESALKDNFDYEELEERYGPIVVKEAISIARAAAFAYPPSYYTNYDDFAPHTWAVAAIAEGIA